MAELKQLTFREFVTLQRGFDLPKKNIKAGVYPVVGSTSVIGYHAEFKANPPGVVIGRSGSLGSVLYISDKYWPHNTSLWVTDFKGNIPRYVYYFLQTLELQRYDSGAAVPTLNRNHLDSLELRIHDLSTQHKIATILNNYDDIIENNTRRIKILEDMAGTIYREWFVEFRFPGHENVKMVESELGLIPKGWEVKGLGNLCKIVPGYAFKSKDWQDTGVGVIKIKDIKSDNTVDVHNTDCVSPEILSPKLDKYRLTNGDFLIAMTGATAGKVGRLRTKTTMMLNQRVAKLNPINIYRDYIWCKISLEETQDAFYRLADGAAQPNMSGSQLENYKIVCPPPSICNHFSSTVGNMLLLSDNLMLRNDNLRKTRDVLLPKLISGELDVSTLDIGTDLYRSQEGEKFYAT